MAYLNMSDPNQHCPSNWTDSSINGFRGCKQRDTSVYSCKSTFFQTNCTVLGYEQGTPDAFANSVIDGYTSIDQAYVDGVSLTHGRPGSRKHIWTFAASFSETTSLGHQAFVCRCNDRNLSWTYDEPSHVGRDYFCDTSQTSVGIKTDPLWSSRGCGPQNGCCDFHEPPWFNKSLAEPTNDDLELRICLGHAPYDEDLIVSLIEIYVS